MWYFLVLVATIAAIVVFLHGYCYRYLKNDTIRRRRRDLNICCGNTDGGGISADIVQHGNVPNFVKLDSIFPLYPFPESGRGAPARRRCRRGRPRSVQRR